MLVHFVGQQDRYQLGNTGKDQVCMEGLFCSVFSVRQGQKVLLYDGWSVLRSSVSYTWPPIQVFHAACQDKCAVPSPDRYRPSVRSGNPCRGLHTGIAAGIFRSWDFLPILFWDTRTYTLRPRCAVYWFLPVSWKGTGHGDSRESRYCPEYSLYFQA